MSLHRFLLIFSILLFSFSTISCDDGESSSAPPVITNGTGIHEAYVGMELSVQINASDPDSSNLVFTYETNDIDNLNTRPHPPTLLPGGYQTAYFIWTPLATDVGEHNIDIIVSDGETEVRGVLTINVNSSTGTNPFPRFLEPLGSGTTLDLSTSTCIDVEIMVEDNDSSMVDIFMKDPINEGYQFNQDSPSDFEAIFSWCPTAQQISESDRYTLNLAADDRDGHITHKRYVIILRRELDTNCIGEAPAISHQVTSSLETLDNISISFSVTDDMGVPSPPIVYYTTIEPANPSDPNPSDFIPITASQTAGDSLSGSYEVIIPNPVLELNPGETASIWYYIEVEDDDDDKGDCDHRTTIPVGSLYETTVTYPSGTIDGLPHCSECQSDIQCGTEYDLCVVLMGGATNCLTDCQDDPDSCPTDTTCSIDPITGTDSAPRRQCIPNSGTCGGGVACTDDSFEDNDSLSTSLPAADFQTWEENLKICSDTITGNPDNDWFRIPLTTTSLSIFEIDFLHASGDLDIQIYDNVGSSIAHSLSVTNNESIMECLPAGEYYLEVYSMDYDVAQSYDLYIDIEENGCCTEDVLEDNDTFSTSLPVESDDLIDELTICSDDEDWFQVDMVQNQILNVILLFDQTTAKQDLDLYIFDTDGTTNLTPCCDPDNGQSETSDEEILFEAPATGTYYIKIEGYDSSENEYMISFEII
jgi:Bacterial pre-peptidase C-terminal domain